MKKNILFVSIAFPPKLDPECIQTARYFKNLNTLNRYRYSIVTSTDKTLYMPADPGLKMYTNSAKDITKIKIFENKYFNSIANRVYPSLLQMPDGKFSFHLQWRKVTKKLKSKPD